MILRKVLASRGIVLSGLVLTLASTLLVATAGIAGNMHFGGGGVSTGSVIFEGVLVGIGSDIARVDVFADGFVTAECTNKGGNAAAGRNLLEIAISDSTFAIPDENGRAEIRLELLDPTLEDILGSTSPSPSPKEAGCPNGNWKVTGIAEVFWTTVHVTATDASFVVQDELFFDCTGVLSGGICPEVTG